MRKTFLLFLFTISLTLLLCSGCAKDQVKPDEGIAVNKSGETASGQTATQKADSQKTAEDLAAAQKAADDLAAAQKAELERLAAQQQQEKLAAAQSGTSAATEPAGAFLKTIIFDFDSYVLTQPARDILYNNAEYLLKKFHGKIKLEGHCDERGSDEYNLALGENRAKAVMNYLLTLGVPAEQLSIISYGKERPLDNGHTEEAWAKNRRVEFAIVK